MVTFEGRGDGLMGGLFVVLVDGKQFEKAVMQMEIE